MMPVQEKDLRLDSKELIEELRFLKSSDPVLAEANEGSKERGAGPENKVSRMCVIS